MSARYSVSDKNPNDTVGGGGCLCSERKHPDCKPPYVIFFHQEMASNLSPHAVACENCLLEAIKEIETGDILGAGEDVIELPTEDVIEVTEEQETTIGLVADLLSDALNDPDVEVEINGQVVESEAAPRI